MTPGLAFFYGGLVRQQNVLTIIMQNFVAMGLVTIIWVVWGFSLCFGKSGKLFGDPSSYAMLSNIEDLDGSIPGLAFARASSPRPETPETKTPRARAPRRNSIAARKSSRRDFSFETSRSPLPRREPRARPRRRSPTILDDFSRTCGAREGCWPVPPVSDSCFLASIRFFLFFQNIRRRRVAVPVR